MRNGKSYYEIAKEEASMAEIREIAERNRQLSQGSSNKQPLIHGDGCIWAVIVVIGLIIGGFCYVRELINDHEWKREIAREEQERKNPHPVANKRPQSYHYHTCSMCGDRYAEEGSYPAKAMWCDRCAKWHCGDCSVECIARNN